jgi:hypothetical protein
MVVGNNEIGHDKNAGKSLAILITMHMRRYDAGSIARWSTSRASLGATECHHRTSACAVLPRPPPWLMNSLKQHKNTNKTQLLASNYGTFRALVVCENFIPQNGPSTQLINVTSFV